MFKVTNKLLDAGIVRITDSPNSFPFLMKKKKDGTFRSVIDYRMLNRITEKEDFPIQLRGY